MAFEDIRIRTQELFLRPTRPMLEEFRGLRAASIAAAEPIIEPPIFSFSIFIPEHVERAMAVVERFMQLADQTKGEAGLESVLDEFEALKTTENPELLYYALMVFITHHPKGRLLTNEIPPLTAREPEKVAPSTAAVTPGEP